MTTNTEGLIGVAGVVACVLAVGILCVDPPRVSSSSAPTVEAETVSHEPTLPIGASTAETASHVELVDPAAIDQWELHTEPVGYHRRALRRRNRGFVQTGTAAEWRWAGEGEPLGDVPPLPDGYSALGGSGVPFRQSNQCGPLR